MLFSSYLNLAESTKQQTDIHYGGAQPTVLDQENEL